MTAARRQSNNPALTLPGPGQAPPAGPATGRISRLPIATYLALLVLVAVLPVLAVGVFALREADSTARGATESRMHALAGTVIGALDALVAERAAVLRAIAFDVTTHDVPPDALAALQERAAAVARHYGGRVAYWDVRGAAPRRLLNTAATATTMATLPDNPYQPLIMISARERRLVVGGVMVDHIDQRSVVPILVPILAPILAPILGDGEVLGVFSMMLTTPELAALLARPGVAPAGVAMVSLIDPNAVIAAREPAERVGLPLPGAFARARASAPPERAFRVTSAAGVEMIYTTRNSALMPGWFAIIGASVAAIQQPEDRRLSLLLAAGALAALVSVLLGGMIWRRIAIPAAAMARLARSQGAGGAVALPPSRVSEFEAVRQSFTSAAAEMHEARQQISLMVDAASLGLWDHELSTGRIFWSRRLFMMMGMAPRADGIVTFAELLGLVHPEDRESYVTQLRALREAPGDTYVATARIIRPDNGEVRWLEAHGHMRGPPGARIATQGVVLDVTDRMLAERTQQLLAREVDHRANNLLAVVQAVIRLAHAPPERDLRQEIELRVMSLKRSHSLLAGSLWQPCPLRQLAEGEVAPLDGRVTVDGPEVLLPPDMVQNLGLILHELTTNALKHGAGGSADGRVRLAWRQEGREVVLRWSESGGPAVSPPVTPRGEKGFGQRLIRASIAAMVGGIEYEWRHDGLVCTLRFPLGRADAPAANPLSAPAAA